MKLAIGKEIDVRGDFEWVGHISGITIAEDSECSEIYAPGILDYIHHSKLEFALRMIVAKLRHGGKLTIGGTDIMEAAKENFRIECNIIEANRVAFGQEDDPKTGQYSLLFISSLLSQYGLKIITKKLHQHTFLVEAVRI